MGKGRVFTGIAVCLFVLSGCAGIREGTRGFLGISTKALEERRAEAISRVFPMDTGTCTEAVREALSDTGAYIYTEDSAKGLIAAYVSRTDTTPVGIFISGHNGQSRIEISSRSTYAKELIAEKLFERLE